MILHDDAPLYTTEVIEIKMCYLFPFLLIKKFPEKVNINHLLENFHVALVKSSVAFLLTISQSKHLNSEPESEAVATYEDICKLP